MDEEGKGRMLMEKRIGGKRYSGQEAREGGNEGGGGGKSKG